MRFENCFYIFSRFVKKYGTHVIVGIKIGGKDVVYAKQHYSSPLESTDVQKILKDVADKRFSDIGVDFSSHHEKVWREMVW